MMLSHPTNWSCRHSVPWISTAYHDWHHLMLMLLNSGRPEASCLFIVKWDCWN